LYDLTAFFFSKFQSHTVWLRLESGALKQRAWSAPVYDQAHHGEKPMLFRQKKESSAPQEKATLSKNIVAGLWKGADRDGTETYRFSLDRVDEQGKIRRTFRVEHLLQLPAAFLKLARAFREAPGVDAAVQSELARLAACISYALQSDGAKGPVREETQASNGRIFGS
jgi:hypothetical protein